MQQQKIESNNKSISLKDIVVFLRCNLALIVACGVIGIVFSLIYISVTPNSFEARWQLAMAQINNSNSEEPTALIQRLKSPTTYTARVFQACDKSGDDVGEYLDKALQVRTVKNVPNIIEFTLRVSNKELATQCANALIAMVIDQQRELIRERLSGRQEQLVQYEHALKEEMQQLEQLKKTELGNFGYLANLDKLTWLRTRIDALQEELFLSQKHPAKLTSPLLVSNKPVAPKKSLIMIIGLLLGLLLGLVYAMSREGWRKLNTMV